MVELIIIMHIIKQTDARLLPNNNSQHCWILHVASVCTPCCMLLRVVGSCCAKFETGQTFQLQCWIRLHSSSNIAGDAHAYHTWSPQSYGLYPSHDTLQVSTLLAQQCGELVRPFASSLRLDADLRYREKQVVTMSQLKPSSSKGG